MNRRSFLRALAAAPALGFLNPFDAWADLPKAKITPDANAQAARKYRPDA